VRGDGDGGRVLSGRGASSPSQAAGEEPLTPPPARDAAVIWHEVECGGYAADLALWEALADGTGAAVLELGCGTGRVALQLIRRGHRVVGLDADAGFVAELERDGRAAGIEGVVGDARGFELDAEFGLAIAPMQLVQLFGDAGERVACLKCVARHLVPGGLAAFAIVESVPATVEASPPLPDTREVDGWVYSSLPIEAAAGADAIRVRRLRQTVSPAGELSEELDEVVLRPLGAAGLEAEGAEAGLRPAGRRAIPATDAHVGSTVVLLEREI
jgi:SAM-dependent methyltransferase